ncbi:MAG: hypothetical protein AB2992_04115 [Candidatus Symbiodolus clandestinus]
MSKNGGKISLISRGYWDPSVTSPPPPVEAEMRDYQQQIELAKAA